MFGKHGTYNMPGLKKKKKKNFSKICLSHQIN